MHLVSFNEHRVQNLYFFYPGLSVRSPKPPVCGRFGWRFHTTAMHSARALTSRQLIFHTREGDGKTGVGKISTEHSSSS